MAREMPLGIALLLLTVLLFKLWAEDLADLFTQSEVKSGLFKMLDPVSTIFQLERNGNIFENLMVSHSGAIYGTRFDAPEIWSVDPEKQTGYRLTIIPGVRAVMGIAELRPNLLVVAAGNFTPGSYQIWKIRLLPNTPAIKQVASIPEANWLNGLVAWDSDNVLVADSIVGAVFKINISIGNYSVAGSDVDTMTDGTSDGSVPPGLGINGIRVHDKYMYFTNAAQSIFCRVKINDDAYLFGHVEIIASGFSQDDFAIDDDGSAYIAAGDQNSVVRVTPTGNVSTLAGSLGAMDLAGSTSCAFRRDATDRRRHEDRAGKVLYVSTSGGVWEPVNGTAIEPGKIAMVHFVRELK
ncbi:uncharacterized protein JN550_005274 [Neoarthrinium moseri]|uniref:uncharacterized protein n=1 Tax=Neoarthrinium moseri TaxID=1658444 RepID=UPI001FDC72B9|nr:uncharacterized protein JN550_005274 [Neoarthrinium moseri]KAI1870346.1 hypothetical protein JN550_005274 [Neoarthrinium moseri]